MIVPVPSLLVGDLLETQLHAAGLSGATVLLSGDIVIVGGVAESDRAAVESILAAHPPTAQAALDAATNERTNATTIRTQAETALASNRTFLNITNPTNAQLAAQVKALTRQNNGLIRLVLNRFDGTD